MAAGTGHGHRVELQITETLNHARSRLTRTPGHAGHPPGHPTPFGLEQNGPGQCQPPGLCNIEGFHKNYNEQGP